ncbi:Uncharacterised protein [Mycobacteroides abscessus]|nr:Uncharacterised protein [Mycobacteroides abscessus]
MSRTRTGTPRNVCMGGWPSGKPAERTSSAISGTRMGAGWSMSSPSRPSPCGQWSISATSSSERPRGMNCARRSRPEASSTPSAPYRAPVSSIAASTMRRSTCGRSRSLVTATTASSTRCPALAGRSVVPLTRCSLPDPGGRAAPVSPGV